jgi:hypothetical protein
MTFSKVVSTDNPRGSLYNLTCIYKGYSREPENVPFIYKLILYALFIDGKIETALLDSVLIYRGVL